MSQFELVINHAQIYDGSGKAPYHGCVGISQGKIAAISDCPLEGKTTIDAQGLALAPGFIDSHSHADGSLLRDPVRLHVLRQGITTEISGQCGHAMAPIPEGTPLPTCHSLAGSGDHGGPYFPSMAQEAAALQKERFGVNQLFYAGHGPIRFCAMGLENRHATQEDIAAMCAQLEACMEAGALGLSTGLSYVPGIYSNTQELIALAKCAAKHGGMYVSHSRSESAGLFKSVQECIDIAHGAAIPVEISHLKVVGKGFWPRCGKMLDMIDQANAEGLQVTMDAYPYTAVSTVTTSAIPARFLDRGVEAFARMLHDPAVVEEIRREIFEIDDPSWDNSALHVGLENFLIVGAEQTPEAVGMTYAQYGAAHGMTPFAAMIHLLRSNHGTVRDVRFAMCEENLEAILKHPLCVLGSDGIYVHGRDTMAHPRAFGSFPRFLGRYVRDRGLMSREEGIRRITGLPADRFGIPNKGYLRCGYDADLVLFDYDQILDQADFTDCFKPNLGIRQVYINGQLVLEDNAHTGAREGKWIPHTKLSPTH